jgi:hypothetical protein
VINIIQYAATLPISVPPRMDHLSERIVLPSSDTLPTTITLSGAPLTQPFDNQRHGRWKLATAGVVEMITGKYWPPVFQYGEQLPTGNVGVNHVEW